MGYSKLAVYFTNTYKTMFLFDLPIFLFASVGLSSFSDSDTSNLTKMTAVDSLGMVSENFSRYSKECLAINKET